MVIGQIAGTAGITLRFRFLRRAIGWTVLTALNGMLLGIAFLYYFALLKFVVPQSVLRLTIVSLWTFALAGLLMVWRQMRSRASHGWKYRGRPTERENLSDPIRRGGTRSLGASLWLATVAVLFAAEPAVTVIDWRGDRLAFPEDLPRGPPQELHLVALGGSMVLGSPYQHKAGMVPFVARQLGRMSSTTT